MSSVAYNGEFVWRITDSNDVLEFLNCKPGTRFSSSIFTIGGLQWQMYAHPKGKFKPSRSNRSFIEGCELSLQLISSSWPSNVYEIIFNYRLCCEGANSSFSNIQSFVYNQDHSVSWYRGTLTTKELEALEGQTIELKCYINILKIIANDQYSIIYQFPFRLSDINTLNIFDYEWKVNNISELFINTKCGKHLESPIFDHFWCLRVAPKGWKLREQKWVNLWLQLCALPMNISKIDIKYTIQCVETNTIYNSRTCAFDYSGYHKNAGWNQKKLVTNSLKKYDSLTFKVQIRVLNKYDLNGYSVEDQPQRKPISGPIYRPKKKVEHENTIIPSPVAVSVPAANNDGPGAVADIGYKEEMKSGEIDGLRQEIVRLNKQVVELQQTVKHLQARIGITGVAEEEKKEMDHKSDDHMDMNKTIIEMLKETKKEIAALKNGNKVAKKEKKMHPVELWLRDVVKLPEYYPIFEENGFDDMAVVKMLNLEQMEKLGIKKLGHQLKIMGAVQNLGNDHTIDGNGNDEEGFYPTPGNSNYL